MPFDRNFVVLNIKFDLDLWRWAFCRQIVVVSSSESVYPSAEAIDAKRRLACRGRGARA